MGRAHEVRKVAMAKTAAAKSKLYAKYGKEIYMAAKAGIPDPESNVALKKIIEKAKKDQVSADVINRAIEKAKGGSDEAYIAVRYEGFGPGNSQLIIEALTDNVNRTIAEVRTIFNKNGGKLGSVLHMFENKAVFTFKGLTEDEVYEILLEGDCDITDLEVDEEFITIYADAQQYNQIRTVLLDKKPELDFEVDAVMWLPLAETTLEGHDQELFERMMNAFDELDDVQEVFHNVTRE